jgi:hypothetical protein
MTEREALQRILLKLKEKAKPLNRSGNSPWPPQAIDFLWELHGIAKQGLQVPLTPEQEAERREQRFKELASRLLARRLLR